MPNLISSVVMFCASLGTVSTDDAIEKQALAELQGSWKLVSIKLSDNDRDLANDDIVCVIRDQKFLYGGEAFATLQVGATSTPRTLDLTLAGGKEPREGIYSLEKDTLTLCLQWTDDGVKERPVEFSAKDHPSLRIVVFQRTESPKPGAEPEAKGFVGIALADTGAAGELSIAATLDDSPARKAGIEADDVLVSIDGVDVTDLRSAVDRIRRVKPGRELALQVKRNDVIKEFKIKVGILPIRALID